MFTGKNENKNQYNVSGKHIPIHIPSEWEKKQDFKDLFKHEYVISDTKESFIFIKKCLKNLGYMEDNQSMVHDYLYFMIIDMLLLKKEVFVTKSEIQNNEKIKKLLNNTMPDFIIKKSKKRYKTLIIDICVGNKDIIDIKEKYKNLEFFADFKIINPNNFTSELTSVFEMSDLDYLDKNYQNFLIEYHYWYACMKLQKILFDKNNIEIQTFEIEPTQNILVQKSYINNLEIYADKISSQDDL